MSTAMMVMSLQAPYRYSLHRPAAEPAVAVEREDAAEQEGLEGTAMGMGTLRFHGRYAYKDEVRKRYGGDATKETLEAALRWLASIQGEDGSWPADPPAREEGLDPAALAGTTHTKVGLTSLALLAFLGDGNDLSRGPYKMVVASATNWLRSQQDPETGLVGSQVGHGFLYDHAIATLALCEVYSLSRSPILKATANKALGVCLRARNPYGAWRYDLPPVGDNDTSVTGWMVLALTAAQDAGLDVDTAAFDGARNWLDEVTDPETGRVGYDSAGSYSSRIPGINDAFPADRGEAMTAVGLFLRQDPRSEERGRRRPEAARRPPPAPTPALGSRRPRVRRLLLALRLLRHAVVRGPALGGLERRTRPRPRRVPAPRR